MLGLSVSAAAHAATLLEFSGPTAEMASPDHVDFTFDAGAGDALASFTIDGFLTLDGLVTSGGFDLEDDFILTVNGTDVLKGAWDLGGGGQNFVYFAPIDATIDAHSNGFNHGGVLTISSPIALVQGQNTVRFAFASPHPEGIGNEGWDLRGLSVSGAAATPEPAAWIMLLMGFFGMGDTLRRSRRRPLPIRV